MGAAEANVRHKDLVFRYLFGSEDRREYTLSLYNALAGTDHDDPGLVRFTTLEGMFYLTHENDVSFMVESEMVLIEHQSTVNPNMPLRGLVYFGLLYGAYAKGRRPGMFGRGLMRIPAPRYVVLYNGMEAMPQREVLRLSDAYEGPGDVEVSATVVNVNAGSGAPELERCPELAGYAELIARIRALRGSMDPADAIAAAVDACIADGILAEYLTERRAEVEKGIFDEYTLEEVGEIYREQGIEQGFQQGRADALFEGALSLMGSLSLDAAGALDALGVPDAERPDLERRLRESGRMRALSAQAG